MARAAGRRQADARGELTAELIELIRGAPELVAFGCERARDGPGPPRATRALVALGRRDALAAGAGDALGLLVTGLTVGGVLAVAAAASADGRLDRVLIALLACSRSRRSRP